MAIAVDQFAPFDSGPGAGSREDTWRAFMRNVLNDGIIAGVADELKLYADSTGMQVKFAAGECWIQGHWGKVASEKTHGVAAAHDSLERIDRGILRCDFQRDLIECDVLTGTAGDTNPPPLTRNDARWEVHVGRITVPPNATSLGPTAVTDERSPVGGPLTYTPVLSTINGNLVLGAGGQAVGRWERRGKSIRLRCTIQFGGAGLDARWGDIRITLPPGITTADYEQSGHAKLWTPSTSTAWIGQLIVPPAGVIATPWFPFSNDINDTNPLRAATSPGTPGGGLPQIPGQYTIQQLGNLTVHADLDVA